jgi:hypothetical protein
MLAVSSVLVVLAVRSALPGHRLRPVIGSAAVDAASIELLRVHDSFNGGIFYAGVISGQTDLMSLIREHRQLKVRQARTPLIYFRSVFPDVAVPNAADVYSDDHGSFLAVADGHRIYFWHTSLGSTAYDGEQTPAGDVLKAAPEQ